MDLRDLLAVQRAVLADAALEVGAAQVLHHDVVGVAVLAPVVDRDDVRALQRGGRLRLLLEARGKGGVGRILRQHRLDGHGAPEHLVEAAVHDGHATGADLVLHFIASAENPSWHLFLPFPPHGPRHACVYRSQGVRPALRRRTCRSHLRRVCLTAAHGARPPVVVRGRRGDRPHRQCSRPGRMSRPPLISSPLRPAPPGSSRAPGPPPGRRRRAPSGWARSARSRPRSRASACRTARSR